MHGHRPDAHDPASPAHVHGDASTSAHFAARLEVEGELSVGVVEAAISECAGLLDSAGVPVRRVLDLGCGPGVATVLLARAFPSALVLAVDRSRAMLDRAEARAERLGSAGRVETRQLDLDEDLASLGRCDLAWAAMAIHHAGDEVATLRRIGSLVDPRGLVCVLERADPMVLRFASEDLGRPGLWDRLEAAGVEWFERVRDRMPGAMNAEAYPAMLAAAGLELVIDRTVVSTLEAPSNAATHRFIAGLLQRMERDLAGVAAEDDLAALRAFVERTPPFPDGRWQGATITSSRKLLIARRAAA